MRIKHHKNLIRECGSSPGKGSATVEALIVLPIFMVCLLTLAYLIRIFMAYSTMQSALQHVARNISSGSYFYYVSGLKDFSDTLEGRAEEAGETLEGQKDTLLGAVTSFNDALAAIQGGNSFHAGDMEQLAESYGRLSQNMMKSTEEAKELIQNILRDPKAEGKLLLTLFTQQVSYEVRKQLVCMAAREMLHAELAKRSGKSAIADVYQAVGIGKAEIDFQGSQVFGDKESLEFIVRYPVRTPMPFQLIPEITLSNRVKLIAWTGGRGQSVRVTAQGKSENGEDSIWNDMDSDQRYWDRGLQIEQLQMDEIKTSAIGRGMSFMATGSKFPCVDAFVYNSDCVQMYDVFTLNPFMDTYQEKPGKIKSEIKSHGKRLTEFDPSRYPDAPKADDMQRIVVVIIPQNADPQVEQYFQQAKDELTSMGIDQCILVRQYGDYHPPPEQVDESTQTSYQQDKAGVMLE